MIIQVFYLGKNVDGIQMQLVSLSGYNVRYRGYVGGRWLPWITGNSDYAGIFGQPIEAIQAEIVSGNSGGGDMSQSKILKHNSSLSPEQQKLGHWCGPAALNAVDCFYYNLSGKNTDKTQNDMAILLATTTQTSFGSCWEIALNGNIPGNLYSLYRAENYTSSAWISKVKERIMRNIDMGYPVIADTLQNASRGFLTENYNQGRDIYHYITVIGYMIKSDGSCYFRYMDSYSKNHGVYTVPLYTLANITYGNDLGIVCY
ncbi:C39 family peptidase [Clostridium botulinum]|uniref:C39 family peptidase n=1 Tax=Clostridium botulinum TaxID=1491 RepID=UPI0014743B6D|nr:C39 family peptidase [Clostridium botulinum]